MWDRFHGWIALVTGALAMAAGSGTLCAQGANEVYFGAFYKPVCDKVISGFEAATATTYPAWERRNHAAVAAPGTVGRSTFDARRASPACHSASADSRPVAR